MKNSLEFGAQCLVLLAFASTSCNARDKRGELGVAESPAQGPGVYGPNCTASDRALLSAAFAREQIIVSSNAFRECMADYVANDFARCDGGPGILPDPSWRSAHY